MQLTEPEVMTTEKANWLREACLRDLKERLVEKARLIQEWYQREQRQLKEKQSWYQENQVFAILSVVESSRVLVKAQARRRR